MNMRSVYVHFEEERERYGILKCTQHGKARGGFDAGATKMSKVEALETLSRYIDLKDAGSGSLDYLRTKEFGGLCELEDDSN